MRLQVTSFLFSFRHLSLLASFMSCTVGASGLEATALNHETWLSRDRRECFGLSFNSTSGTFLDHLFALELFLRSPVNFPTKGWMKQWLINSRKIWSAQSHLNTSPSRSFSSSSRVFCNTTISKWPNDMRHSILATRSTN